MTKKQASIQKLEFTGIYNRYKEETRKRIVEARKNRPKARIILVNEACGWSAYADVKYFAYSTLEDSNNILDLHERKLERLKFEYEAAVQKQKETYQKPFDKRRHAYNVLAE